MTDREKITMKGFASELEKDASKKGIGDALIAGEKAITDLFSSVGKSLKGSGTAFKKGVTGKGTKSTLTGGREKAFNAGKKLYDNKKNIAAGGALGGATLTGAGVNEVFSDD